MPKPVPRASQLAPCPLRERGGAVPKHLAWKDPTGWVVAFGTPSDCEPIFTGETCWHFAMDCVTRWHVDPDNPDDRGGWITPAFRVNKPLDLPDGQTVCDICYADLTGGAR